VPAGFGLILGLIMLLVERGVKLNRDHSSENERHACSGIEYCSVINDAVNFIITNYTRN
jgi:large-conductance mechanosensitive channel